MSTHAIDSVAVRALRVVQLDALRLDEALTKMATEALITAAEPLMLVRLLFGRMNHVIGSALTTASKPPTILEWGRLFLAMVLHGASLFPYNSTYGQRLLGLRLANKNGFLSTATKVKSNLSLLGEEHCI